MYFVYQTGIYSYYLLILFASLFNKKAALWINGRKNQRKFFGEPLPPAKRIWFHFASLGEFEQGRFLLEKINENYPEYKIIVTFFSPSGYEIRKNYALAEKVYYLPLDTKKNAIQFLNHIKPDLIFFNKYEYWYHYISQAKKRNIPLFVISAIFREEQLFFKSYGSFQRKILQLVHYFFVQNKQSLELLKSINIDAALIAGDTRFDRVYEHSLAPKKDFTIEQFCLNSKVFVGGSTWEKDELLIKEIIDQFPKLKFIIVPHEVSASNIKKTQTLFGEKADLYSKYKGEKFPSHLQVIIVDTIGMLNSIYMYSDYCYIGGGIGKGIHNTLEAVAFGKAIFFGPNYQNFSEAKELITLNIAKSIINSDELSKNIQLLENNFSEYQKICTDASNYIKDKKGASGKILDYLKSNNFLA